MAFNYKRADFLASKFWTFFHFSASSKQNFLKNNCLTLILATCYRSMQSYVKVTGDNLLIYEFAYSLFIGLCSVTSNMTDYSHLYHSIKLIPSKRCIE